MRKCSLFIGTGVVLGVVGCAPLPLQSPRVERGVEVNGMFAVRVIHFDSSKLDLPVPDVGVSLHLGAARRDSSGFAARVGGTLSALTLPSIDGYVQLPRVRRVVAGAGANLILRRDTARHVVAPFASVGWDRPDQMIFLTHSIVPFGNGTNYPAGSTTLLGVRARGGRMPVGRLGDDRTLFLALFRSLRRGESPPSFLAELTGRSVWAFGMTVNATTSSPYRGPPAPVPRPPGPGR